MLCLADVFTACPIGCASHWRCADILKVGGQFAIVNWYGKPREQTRVLGEPRGPATELRMTPEQTIMAVEQSSLTFRRQIEVSPYHYAAILSLGQK